MIKRILPTPAFKAAINANSPSDTNPFATIADVIGINIVTVPTYSSLPSPATVTNKYYRTLVGENSSWRPAWLGGTYYPKGIYFSDGSTWDYVGEFPYQADQLEVDAGVNDKNFVTPLTLKNAAQWSSKQDVLGYTPANKAGETFTGNISAPNLSGTNTGDETTSSIQTKRPIKTVNGNSLEGSGDIDLNNGNTTIIKSSNQDIIGTTGNDTELFFPVVAGGIYHIKFSFIMSCNKTSADSKTFFRTNSATMLGAGGILSHTATGVITAFGGRSISNFSANNVVGAITASLDDPIVTYGEVVYRVSANDTILVGFGNNTATAGATSRMWAGSMISYKKIN